MYEATETESSLSDVQQRECENDNCDGRCLNGRAFGQGFDSPQVHFKLSDENREFLLSIFLLQNIQEFCILCI